MRDAGRVKEAERSLVQHKTAGILSEAIKRLVGWVHTCTNMCVCVFVCVACNLLHTFA